MSTATLEAPTLKTNTIPQLFDPKKNYRVRLSRQWKQPKFKQQDPPSGVLYQRGEGKFQWTVKTATTEYVDELVINGADINQYLLMPKHQRFERDGLEYELDKNLIAEEIK